MRLKVENETEIDLCDIGRVRKQTCHQRQECGRFRRTAPTERPTQTWSLAAGFRRVDSPGRKA